ncbi:uncharacterized protein LOC134187625 [Corticium candelabrum]|uniref:uncharacterized protein LOC134187625 n=1 Tax=Corticium candelabrum TaxID=121492 RepID=UPI002E26289F|nr:uncharacterized protein LOC134187625 [Corticium candelabrum]
MNLLAVSLFDWISLTWIVYTCISTCCVVGKPVGPSAQLREKRSASSDPCRHKFALISGAGVLDTTRSGDTRVVQVVSSRLRKTVATANASKSLITLENLFQQSGTPHKSKHVYHYQTYSGHYLTVDTDGNLQTTASVGESVTILQHRVEGLPNDYTILLCAWSENQRQSYLLYIDGSIRTKKLQIATACQASSNFVKALSNDVILKSVDLVHNEVYHFYRVFVTFHDDVSRHYSCRYLSRELKTVCCVDSCPSD